MARPKFNLVRDRNHKPIQDHLEENGCEVIDVSKIGNIVDLLVYYIRDQRISAIEVKIPGSLAAFTKPQLRWMAGTRLPLRIVTTKEAALEFATTHKGALTDGQKHRLRVLADTTAAEQIRPEAVERVLTPTAEQVERV